VFKLMHMEFVQPVLDDMDEEDKQREGHFPELLVYERVIPDSPLTLSTL